MPLAPEASVKVVMAVVVAVGVADLAAVHVVAVVDATFTCNDANVRVEVASGDLIAHGEVVARARPFEYLHVCTPFCEVQAERMSGPAAAPSF